MRIPSFRSLSTRAKAAIAVLLPLAFMALVTAVVTGYSLSRENRESALAYTSGVTETIALDLDRIISDHQLMAITMASIYSSEPTRDREKVKKLLVDLFGKSSWIVATYAGWEPDAFDGDDKPWAGKPTHTVTGQFVPFIHCPNSIGMIHDPARIFVDSLQNIDKYDFYMGPKRTNAPFITPPWTYRGHRTGNLQKLVCVTAPIQWPDGSFRGMAGVNIDTGAMLDKFNSLKVMDHGLVFIIYKTGLLLTFPDESITFSQTILDIGDRFGNANLDKLIADIAAGRKGVTYGRHPVTGVKSWIVYHPVPTSEWGVVLVAPRMDVFRSRNTLIIVLMALFVLTALGAFMVIRRTL